LAAWNYFMSIDTAKNAAFIKQWHNYIKDPKRTVNDPMEAHFIGFNMWVKAVEKAGTVESNAVQKAIIGIEVPNLTGATSKMLANHHITKPAYIGEIQDDGQFLTIWQSNQLIEGDAWSNYVPESKDIVADWSPGINCGNYNSVTKKCSSKIQ